MAEPLVGQIMLFGGNYAPRGWAFCDGQLLSISEYPTLYSVIGTYYGGDGTTTFGLPDLRGRAAIGAGYGPGLSPYQVGQMGGSEYTLLTHANLPSHSHAAAISGTATATGAIRTSDTATQASPDGAYPAPLTASFGGEHVEAKGYGTVPSGNTMASDDLNVDLSSVSVATGNTGGGEPVYHLQPYTATRYIIALDGVYPARN